jgi:hypothetical protein
MFSEIGSIPQPVDTRWGTWLEAVLYYCDHLPQVRGIVETFLGDGIILTNARNAVSQDLLPNSLLTIKRCYEPIFHLIKKAQSTSYNVAEAYKDLTAINCREDVCGVKGYLAKRLAKNEIVDIVGLTRPNISPSLYAKLLCAQATSVSVERSFSMQKKLLAKDRNFLPDNAEKFLILHYNSVTE